jgi:hypothetical protein
MRKAPDEGPSNLEGWQRSEEKAGNTWFLGLLASDSSARKTARKMTAFWEQTVPPTLGAVLH